MSQTRLAVVLHGKNDLRLEEMPLTEPGDGEVQVAVHSVGVCGTDIHNWQNGYMALEGCPLTSPMILGHESSGTVIALGDGVQSLKIGDRVALNPAVPCLKCEFCQEGKPSLCTAVPLSIVIHGHFTRKCNQPAEFCYRLADKVSFEEGALLEPFTVALYACQRANVTPGCTLLIVGAGSIGMLTLMAAQISGAMRIIIADISAKKLEFAKKMGASDIYLIQSKDCKAEADNIVALLGYKPDMSIECSGTEPGITTAIYATRPSGRVTLAGLAPQNAKLPMMYASINQIDIITVFRYGDCYKRALALINSGRVNLKPLVSQHYPLKDTVKCFQDIVDGKITGDGVKAMIDCQE